MGPTEGCALQRGNCRSTLAAVRPDRALLQVLGAFAEVAARVRAAGHLTPIGGSADPELAGVDRGIGARR